MLTDKKYQSVNAGDGAVSTSGAENERVENTLRVLGVRVTASVDVRSGILAVIGGSQPPGTPEEGRENDDGDENVDGGGKQAEGAPPRKKEAPA